MKNGKISRGVPCKPQISVIEAVIDFIRTLAGGQMACYSGNKQVAVIPSNATPDFLKSLGIDLNALRATRDKELYEAGMETPEFFQKLLEFKDNYEALIAAQNARKLEMELGLEGVTYSPRQWTSSAQLERWKDQISELNTEMERVREGVVKGTCYNKRVREAI